MRIGVLGTGIVGETIGTRLVGLDHEVRMGAREATNERARAWAEGGGGRASHGSFADAAAFGELIVNCTSGAHSLDALHSAGPAHLYGKVLIDVANPLDFSGGMPPTLGVCNTDSLGEQIQRAFPEARVVKALSTMKCAVMVRPDGLRGGHDMPICGDDAAAKARPRRSCGASAGRRSESSIWATSRRRAAWRCTSRSGCACGARSAPATSTSQGGPLAYGPRAPSPRRRGRASSA